jgi:hypothetical protein
MSRRDRQGGVGQRLTMTVSLAQLMGLQAGVHISCSTFSRMVFWNIASMPGSVRPAARAFASQARSSC